MLAADTLLPRAAASASRSSKSEARPSRSVIFDERSASLDAREAPGPVLKNSASALSASPLAVTRAA